MKRLREAWAALDVIWRLVGLGAMTGAAFLLFVWPPLVLLFLAVLSFVLAAVFDRRTPPEVAS